MATVVKLLTNIHSQKYPKEPLPYANWGKKHTSIKSVEFSSYRFICRVMRRIISGFIVFNCLYTFYL